MKTRIRAFILLACVLVPSAHASDLSQKMADAITQYLALGRNFSLVHPANQVGQVYKAPVEGSPQLLEGVLNAAVPLSLTTQSQLAVSGIESELEQQYRVGPTLSNFIAYAIESDLAKHNISAAEMANRLAAAGIRFQLYRHTFSEPLASQGVLPVDYADTWVLVATQALSVGSWHFSETAGNRLADWLGEPQLLQRVGHHLVANTREDDKLLALKLLPASLQQETVVALD